MKVLGPAADEPLKEFHAFVEMEPAVIVDTVTIAVATVVPQVLDTE